MGDFDSVEYAQNLTKLIRSKKYEGKLEILFISIGNSRGKKRFCQFTGFPNNNLKVIEDNKLHNQLGIYKGLDIGFGSWINMVLMLSGFNSAKTILEVIRGYTGDKNSREIYKVSSKIKFFNFINFSGKLFETSFGKGYLRPFELATYRLNNMIEIISNWKDYVSNSNFLPQRGATFLINKNNKLIYKYFSMDILSYSENMSNPLAFIFDKLE